MHKLCLLFLALTAAGSDQPARTEWFRQARFGVCMHYLSGTAEFDKEVSTTAEHWNRRIDDFDVEGLAQQLDSAGARYFFITLGQNSGFYLSPNQTYDRLVGITPAKCSRRDLVADLYGSGKL